MSSIGISDPQLTINNISIPIVPGSFKFKPGMGETNVRVESSGGGNTNTVYSKNVSTMFSEFSFQMVNTDANFALAKTIKANFNANAAALANGADPDFTLSWKDFAIKNDFETTLSPEGTIEIECAGSPAQ